MTRFAVMKNKAMLLLAVGSLVVLGSVPAHAQDSTEPARLDAARQVVIKMVPSGAYARLMSGMADQMGSMVTAQMDSVPLGGIAKALGIDATTAAKLDKVKISQINEIIDPYYKERSQRTLKAMFAGLGEIIGKLEPDIREALARAYARRFTTAQLNDINTFFATPTGGLFATTNLELTSDPEYIKTVQKMMPAMMEQMPTLIGEAAKATADLPPPKKYESLSDADKKKIKALLGI